MSSIGGACSSESSLADKLAVKAPLSAVSLSSSESCCTSVSASALLDRPRTGSEALSGMELTSFGAIPQSFSSMEATAFGSSKDLMIFSSPPEMNRESVIGLTQIMS
ncbi:hypothetical protein OGAPHI_005874 [Ogataea philodendri]|uniref:Uncharacterized protein n=1 Tax=Ogataea philodendri TaxID=1378263 RepID=A0A9P8P0I4_9ASCO|nr:uncharacterized protein OGAPHI_005874 [Ogataea philodendri]KAH3662622.1 hypothetical protein OGAPHI_005874 [Ogataea philodendri]